MIIPGGETEQVFAGRLREVFYSTVPGVISWGLRTPSVRSLQSSTGTISHRSLLKTLGVNCEVWVMDHACMRADV